MSVRGLRISQLWTERRRRKQDEKQTYITKNTVATEERPRQDVDKSLTATIERNARRLSRLWRNDAKHEEPTRQNSARQVKNRRSFFNSNDEPVLVLDETAEENTAPPLERETLLKKLRRKSQILGSQRPSTSTGIPKRPDSFFDSNTAADNQEAPPMPPLLDLQGQVRPRHVPITLGAPEYDRDQPTPVTGVAITSNFVQSTNHAFSEKEKPRTRPISSSSSFSQLRVRSTRRSTFHNSTKPATESESSDEDVLTALPFLDFKDFNVGELRTPGTLAPVVFDRLSVQRGTAKVVDIVSPRPLSMISSNSARKEPLPRARPKSLAQPVKTPIGPLEDGPKGDWARTRYSWTGLGEGDSDQLEWDKLKQFMEAYGNGQDGGIISVRPVDTDSSNSSGSTLNSQGVRYSNAQALAALEFGLT